MGWAMRWRVTFSRDHAARFEIEVEADASALAQIAAEWRLYQALCGDWEQFREWAYRGTTAAHAVNGEGCPHEPIHG
jgi:hypothetical protein